jgi:hypothetical protein
MTTTKVQRCVELWRLRIELEELLGELEDSLTVSERREYWISLLKQNTAGKAMQATRLEVGLETGELPMKRRKSG